MGKGTPTVREDGYQQILLREGHGLDIHFIAASREVAEAESVVGGRIIKCTNQSTILPTSLEATAKNPEAARVLAQSFEGIYVFVTEEFWSQLRREVNCRSMNASKIRAARLQEKGKLFVKDDEAGLKVDFDVKTRFSPVALSLLWRDGDNAQLLVSSPTGRPVASGRATPQIELALPPAPALPQLPAGAYPFTHRRRDYKIFSADA